MAGFLSSQYVSRNCPCVICRKPDWCSVATFSDGTTLHYCQRVQQSSVIGLDGEQYYNKINKRYPDGKTSGGASVYESVRQREASDAAYKEKMQRENPNYKGNNRSFSAPVAEMPVIQEMERIVVDEVKPLSNDKLDKVYRYLLSLLYLEKNHEEYLRNEWNKGFNKNLADQLFGTFPIKSLPMNDQARFQGGYTLKNLSRKKIIEKMIERFSTLVGVPGFYQDQNGTWRMVNLSGIIYPEFDSDGYMYRIRLMDEHPKMSEYIKNLKGFHIYDYKDDEVPYLYDYYFDQSGRIIRAEKNGSEQVVYDLKKDKDGNIIHEESIELIDVSKLSIRVIGTYSFNQKTGEWYRLDSFTNENEVVFSIPKNIRKVELTLQGYPKIDGKVDGKYKNFSSYSETTRTEDNKIFVLNRYQNGCQSGSNVSLYRKEGDNTRFVYITEGEKKAMVINQMMSCPAISLPGVNTYSKVFDNEYGKSYSMFKKLVESGATHFLIVFDADKNQNQAVLNAESRAIELSMAHGIETITCFWDKRYGKGADDILISGKSFCVSRNKK